MSLNTRLRGKTAILPIAERELAVLRLIGRLGLVLGQTVGRLLFPDRHPATARDVLGRLTKRELIWRTSLPTINVAGRSSGRPFAVYGLTTEGRQLIQAFGAEPHIDTFERLITRPKHAGKSSFSERDLETYISDWCADLLDQVRRSPTLVGAHVQRSYAVTNAEGALEQTIGALIVLAFDKQQQTVERPGWAIPWLTDGVVPPTWHVVRLALEVDVGVRGNRGWFDLALTYRRCADDGLHTQVIGGAVRPVIISPNMQRVKTVGEQWAAAWPGSPTLITSRARTTHPKYGVLWGTYSSLKTKPVQQTPLLGSLLGTVEQWPAKTKHWPG